MKPLSKREKVLLYILAVAAIISGVVVLIIQPAMDKSTALDDEILEQQMAVDTVKAELLTQQALIDEIKSAEDGVAEESTYFLPFMTNNELDEYITGLLQTHGLTAMSLAMVSGSEGGNQSQETPMPVSGDIRNIRVETTAYGTMTQFMLLIDTVRELDGIRISALENIQETLTTPAPTPTPKPAKKKRVTPEPLFTAPTPQPKEAIYSMNITFSVLEYANGASTSVTLDRGE